MWNLLQDVRLSFRILGRRPGFAILGVVALALGIGANTAVYRFAKAVLWRPLAVRDPGSVVTVLHGTEKRQFGTHAYADFEYYRDHTRALGQVAARTSSDVVLDSNDSLETAVCEFVSPEYFPLLGVSPALGRPLFQGASGGSGAEIPALLSDRFYRRHFGANPDAVGRSIQISRRLVTVVGVAPSSYEGIDLVDPPDLWLPLSAYADIREMPPAARTLLFTGRSNASFGVVGRLKTGTTPAQAQAEIQALRSQLDASMEPASSERGSSVRVLPIERARLSPQERGPVVDFIWVVGAAAFLILLLACLNGTSLMLARFLDRTRELAMRLALGATRPALIRQLTVEATTLTLLGGAAGLVLSGWCARWFGQAAALAGPSIRVQYGLDWATVAFSGGLSLALGLAVGVLPALRASQVDLVTALKDGRAPVGVRRWRLSLNDLFLVAQVSVSVVLLLGATLLLLSVRRAFSVELGFTNRDLHIVALSLQSSSPTSPVGQGKRAYLELLDRVTGLSEVESATVAAMLPLGRRKFMSTVQVREGDRPDSVDGNSVAGDYFATMGIRMIRGRPIDRSDAEGHLPVAVVNEAFAARYWPRESPLGKTFRLPSQRGGTLEFEVVGIAQNGKYRELGEAPRPFFYLSLDQHGFYPNMNLIVRPRLQAGKVLANIRNEVRRSSQPLAISGITSMSAHLDNKLLRQRLGSQLMGAASAIALLLTVVGIASATAYSVARRRAEIAIRMAVGATPRAVLRMLLTKGLVVIGIGLALGYALAVATGRLLAALLFGVGSGDPAVLAAVGALIVVAGTAAVFFPALAATRIDPMEIVRSE